MRIGIDARFLTHPQKGGFKSYTENLIRSILDLDQENEYILYLDRDLPSVVNDFEKSNITARIVPGSHPGYGMILREQHLLPQQAIKDKLDVFHAPCLTSPLMMNIPLVVTLHDMIWYYPTKYSKDGHRLGKRKLMEWYYRIIPRLSARKATAIITVSNASKQSIARYLKIPERRLFVTYEAPANVFRPINKMGAIESVRNKYNLGSKYILGLGSADPRKNINALVRAYAMLPISLRGQYQLAIIWNHKSLEFSSSVEAEKAGIFDQLRFLENVNDDDLATLYGLATVFVFPSLEEGFGLPPLEAMACGAAVLAANNSSIPEIVGNAALMFDANYPSELADLLAKVLSDSELRNEMREMSIQRAGDFSWRKCAHETIEVYKQAMIMSDVIG